MNYQKHYDKLCSHGRAERPTGYYERHHIIPKCLGGSNAADNITILTAKEHFVAHHLLCKLYPAEPKIKLALQLMMHMKSSSQQRNYIVTARSYAYLKAQLLPYYQSRPNNFKGRKHTPEAIEKNRQAHLGKKLTIEHKEKIRLKRLGQKQPQSQKEAVQKALSKTWQVTDPYGTSQTIANLRQFCLANQLDQGNMVAVSKGRLPAHKGWTCRLLG